MRRDLRSETSFGKVSTANISNETGDLLLCCVV